MTQPQSEINPDLQTTPEGQSSQGCQLPMEKPENVSYENPKDKNYTLSKIDVSMKKSPSERASPRGSTKHLSPKVMSENNLLTKPEDVPQVDKTPEDAPVAQEKPECPEDVVKDDKVPGKDLEVCPRKGSPKGSTKQLMRKQSVKTISDIPLKQQQSSLELSNDAMSSITPSVTSIIINNNLEQEKHENEKTEKENLSTERSESPSAKTKEKTSTKSLTKAPSKVEFVENAEPNVDLVTTPNTEGLKPKKEEYEKILNENLKIKNLSPCTPRRTSQTRKPGTVAKKSDKVVTEVCSQDMKVSMEKHDKIDTESVKVKSPPVKKPVICCSRKPSTDKTSIKSVSIVSKIPILKKPSTPKQSNASSPKTAPKLPLKAKTGKKLGTSEGQNLKAELERQKQLAEDLTNELSEKDAAHAKAIAELNLTIKELEEKVEKLEKELASERRVSQEFRCKISADSQTIKMLKGTLISMDTKVQDTEKKHADLAKRIKTIQDGHKSKEGQWQKENNELKKTMKEQEMVLQKIAKDRDQFETRFLVNITLRAITEFIIPGM